MPTVHQLFIYPLKSAQGIESNYLTYNHRGPSFDRHWMVVNAKGRFLTQRQYPSMCLIHTQLDEGKLILNAPNQSSLAIEFSQTESSNNECVVDVWKDQVTAIDHGQEAANWISSYLNEECRIVSMPKTSERKVDLDFASNNETVSFADGFPSLVISQESLDDFNSKLDTPISMIHFRPNIVINGLSPYEEDQIKAIKINGITFTLVKPCSRCIIPSIDPKTGKKNIDIAKALSKYRRRDNATYFGQNALHDAQGEIKVGDQVEIIR